MALANPAARFNRLPQTQQAPQLHGARPFARRSVCVLPKSVADLYDHRAVVTRCCGGTHTHFTRESVVALVAAGEMRWVDRHHNAATHTTIAAATWQKCGSGPVATMQMRVGRKGRYIPAQHRDPDLIVTT